MEEKYNKILWLCNFETDKHFTFLSSFCSEDLLNSYNKNWYNIYQTVNTFIGKKRQIKDLAEIKSCFVDIDYAEIVSNSLSEKERATYLKNKFVLEVKPTLEQIKTVYWLSPNQINVTYKWFHILFHYEKYCYFIDTDLHIKINDKLNNLLWGDPNARDLARVYKSVWYIDHKSNRSCKIIELKNTGWCVNKESVITKEIIEERFEEEYSERNIWKVENKKNSSEKREFVKNENINKMNSIDALVFIENIKEFLKVYKITFEKEKTKDELEQIKSQILNKLKYEKISETTYKLFESDWLSLTSWLTIDLDSDWIWKINDYSQKNRRWNYNFLKNWIFKDIDFDYNLFSKLLYKTTKLTLNSNLDKNAIVDSKLFWDLIYKRIKFEDPSLKSIEQRILTKINSPWYLKTFEGLLIYLYDNIKLHPWKIKLDDKNRYIIEYNDFLEIFGITTKDGRKLAKNVLNDILYQISSTMFPFEEISKINWIEKTIITFKPIMELSIIKWWQKKGDKDIFFIKPIQTFNFIFSNKTTNLNKNILKFQAGFKDTYFTDFLIEADAFMRKSGHHYSEKLEIVFKKLNYKSSFIINRKNLKKQIEHAISKNIFKSYSLSNDVIVISNEKVNNIENRERTQYIKQKEIEIFWKKIEIKANEICKIEKDIQEIIEWYINTMEDVKEVKRFYKIPNTRQILDTLVELKNWVFIVIEYKFGTDKRVISQAMGYSYYLKQHLKIDEKKIKTVIIQNKFKESDFGVKESFPNLFFYQWSFSSFSNPLISISLALPQ